MNGETVIISLDEIDKAYWAGIFDGEGTIFIEKKRLYLVVAIVMTDSDLLEELRNESKLGRISKSNGKKPNHRTTYRWYCYRMEAEQFLKLIYPHSRVKKLEIIKALEFQSNKGFYELGKGHKLSEEIIKRRKNYANELSQLKGRIK